MAAHGYTGFQPVGWLGMGEKLPTENKHLTSERQQTMQTRGSTSPTSSS